MGDIKRDLPPTEFWSMLRTRYSSEPSPRGPFPPQELVEAVVLPIQHKDRFIKLGIRPPKGVLCYGPPGTGKTLIARCGG